jgi:hypothetical protein
MDNMVPIVVNPKIEATKTTLSILFLAAGYIIRGISGSHGPKTNTVNSTHGVKPPNFES